VFNTLDFRLIRDWKFICNNNSNNNDKSKYKTHENLSIEIQRMWNMKCFVIPVITGATGIVNKSLQKYLETTPGQHSIDSLQQTAILGTSHIIRKVLQAET
jgi:hypothetical protein